MQKRSSVFRKKIGVTPSVAAPGDTNPSDATAYKQKIVRNHREPIVVIVLANVNSSSSSLYVIGRPSVVSLSSVTLVHPTQTIEIFGNISTPCGTLAIHDLCIKILRRSS